MSRDVNRMELRLVQGMRQSEPLVYVATRMTKAQRERLRACAKAAGVTAMEFLLASALLGMDAQEHRAKEGE